MDADGVRQLAVAVLLRAVQDARAGDATAARWLERDPWAAWLADAAEISPAAMRRWAARALHPLRCRVGAGPPSGVTTTPEAPWA